MIAQKRDANEGDIVAAAKAAGAFVIPMDKSAGFDLLVIHRSGTHIVEVKNPARKWSLTRDEQKTERAVEKAGQFYNIVETAEDMLEVLGMK